MRYIKMLFLLLFACLLVSPTVAQEAALTSVGRHAIPPHGSSVAKPNAPSAREQPTCREHFNPRFVTSFRWNSKVQQWPESLAIDTAGNMYVSITDYFANGADDVGYVVKVSPDGRKKVIASIPDLSGWGFLAGVALDERGRLYVNVVNDSPGVYRVEDDGKLVLELSLSDCSTPNGIVFHEGEMYVTDSSYNCTCGAIWKKGRHDTSAPAMPWYSDCDLIAPGSLYGLGANGIAFYRGEMYVGVYDTVGNDWGRIVRFPITHDGSPGEPVVVAEDPDLVLVDGIAFDVTGKLWIVTNYNDLGTVALDGTVTLLANDPGCLDDPTMVAFGATPETRTRLFVTNGGGTSLAGDVLSLEVHVSGVPLPPLR